MAVDQSARECGHRLRLTRLALGLTEAEAAGDLGVSLRTYRRYEARGFSRKRWQRREDDFYDKYEILFAGFDTAALRFSGRT